MNKNFSNYMDSDVLWYKEKTYHMNELAHIIVNDCSQRIIQECFNIQCCIHYLNISYFTADETIEMDTMMQQLSDWISNFLIAISEEKEEAIFAKGFQHYLLDKEPVFCFAGYNEQIYNLSLYVSTLTSLIRVARYGDILGDWEHVEQALVDTVIEYDLFLRKYLF